MASPATTIGTSLIRMSQRRPPKEAGVQVQDLDKDLSALARLLSLVINRYKAIPLMESLNCSLKIVIYQIYQKTYLHIYLDIFSACMTQTG